MKKLVLIAAVFFSVASIGVAQGPGNSDFGHSQGNSGNSGNNDNNGNTGPGVTSGSAKGSATLTVKLDAVQSISVDGDVVIHYTSADDYANGKGSEDVTTLNVVSAGGFAISVQADDLTGGAKDIPASTIAVTAEAGSNGSGTYAPNITLAKVATGTKAPLITSKEGGVDKQYKVSYRGTGSNEYMKNYNADNAEKGTQVYTTTVYYTIAAN